MDGAGSAVLSNLLLTGTKERNTYDTTTVHTKSQDREFCRLMLISHARCTLRLSIRWSHLKKKNKNWSRSFKFTSRFTDGSRPTFLKITALNRKSSFHSKARTEEDRIKQRREREGERRLGSCLGRCFPRIILAWSAWKEETDEPDWPLQPKDSVQESRQGKRQNLPHTPLSRSSFEGNGHTVTDCGNPCLPRVPAPGHARPPARPLLQSLGSSI